METMAASQLRGEFFHVLERALQGEAVAVTWESRDVARLVPAPSADWQKGMPEKPRLLVAPDGARAPMADVWQGYTQ